MNHNQLFLRPHCIVWESIVKYRRTLQALSTAGLFACTVTGVVERKAKGAGIACHFGFCRIFTSWYRVKKSEVIMSTIPVVVLAGTSGTGKTTFLAKLIRELKSRKITVGTIKHHDRDFEIDKPGKDTWRHAQAGADAVALSSPSKVALIRKVEEELSLDQVAELIGKVDIILVEGYKRADKPKIEIHRKAHSRELLCAPEELIALVSDGEWNLTIPVFHLEDASGVADLLLDTFGLPE
jgi:molybdopterin-guanine dinucleotide biosynthesis protein B